MNDSPSVRGIERLGDLPGDLKRFVNAQGTLRDPVRKRWSFNQLENQRSSPVRFLDPVDVRDVWMIQRSEQVRLALEAGHAIGIRRQAVWQDLDGDVAMQFPVVGAIDLAHAAFTERGDDFVRPKRVARRERHASLGPQWRSL